MATKYTTPKGAETRTNSKGETEYKTQGGNWRNTVSGSVSGKSNSSSSKTKTPAKGLLDPDMPYKPPSASWKSAGGLATQQNYENERNAALTAGLNRFTDVNSYGTSGWSKDPATGQWTRTTTQEQGEKAVSDLSKGANWIAGGGATSMLPQIMNWGQSQYSLSGVPQVMNTGQLDTERKRIEDSLMGRFEERNAPVFDQQRRGLLQEMADQGIPLESAQGQKRLADLARQQQDARQSAMTSAVSFGGTELQNQYDRSLVGRQQGIEEYEKGRYAPLNEFATLKGLNTGGNMPEATPFTPQQVNPTDVAGLGLGFAQIASQEKLAKMAAGGGGGGEGVSILPFNAQFPTSAPTQSSNVWGNIAANTGAAFGNALATGATGMNKKLAVNPPQLAVNRNATSNAQRFRTSRGLLNPIR